MEDLLNALNFGSMIRQTDATAINAKSSRSHAVFSLNLVQRKVKPQESSVKDKRMSMPTDSMSGSELSVTVDSKLHFVDLAGSERLKNTGASGERAKEGISINAGLASLGKVISQLSSRSAGAHVSYRDSKLTRLLQDSLGGNAITYLIACVTPAEFHLSETLNTVQYAQRARAIQTKPQIQAVSDEGDKQALIDRLRAEVQFLRDQIRSSEGRGRNGQIALDRPDRHNEKEIDLQNRLLDVEENYSALSQRHARLISEMSKGREEEVKDMSLPNGTAGESAVERLKRSTSFADAVEQVVLEYEKTIQSLESSLSKTRSSLSTTESSLLEKETKYAYVETINTQLQTRISKLIDRESNTESYLRDIEERLDGRTVGEQRDSAAITDLRKEIARLRDSGNTQEDYITSLEERLADADQSTEYLQREISRLETVIDRQRSVGRLDNLLHELDHGSAKAPTPNELARRSLKATPATAIGGKLSDDLLEEAANIPLPTVDEESDEEMAEKQVTQPRTDGSPVSHDQAQSTFLQEKLEVVNQELSHLRVQHDTVLEDHDMLSAKYEEALRTLAALQDAVEESRRAPPSPMSFLPGNEATQTRPDGNHVLSRSLSSELSSVGHVPDSMDSTESGDSGDDTPLTPREHSLPRSEVEPAPLVVNHVNNTNGTLTPTSSADQDFATLQLQYEELEEQHQVTLDLVEELKAEISKSRLSAPSSPNLIRRKSSQNIFGTDRSNRSLASLENIAAEHFSDNPDLKDNFEINLNNLMQELHQRSEKVKALEAEVTAARKELETKTTIISGLTRERSSLKNSSPVEMSMMSSIRDQMMETERRLQELHASSATREQDLLKEIASLKETLPTRGYGVEAAVASMPGALPETPADFDVDRSLGADAESQQTKITELQAQIAHWEDKHQIVSESMQSTEKRLLATISELEDTLSQVETLRQTKTTEFEDLSNSTAAAAAAFDLEREKHGETVRSMNREIEKRKEALGTQATKLAELEKSHARAQEDLLASDRFKEATLKALDDHREQISDLEQEIAQHQASVEFHKHGLIRLHDAHANDVQARRESVRKHTQSEHEMLITDLAVRHKEEKGKLQQKISDLENQLQDHRTKLDDQVRKFEERAAVIASLENETKTHSRSASVATDELKEAKSRLRFAEEAQTRAEKNLESIQSRVEELQWAKSELNNELEEVREKEQRASRLVEELQGELNSTYIEGRTQSNRLSQLQGARDKELADARTVAIKAQEEATTLRSRVEQLEVCQSAAEPQSVSNIEQGPQGRTSPLPVNGERTNSLNSFRKPATVTSLPSPPPNMPLPPIPTGSPREGRTSPGSSAQRSSIQSQRLEEQDSKIRQMDKHLKAEKQLTQTLEEALLDLEAQVNKKQKDIDIWKQKAWGYEEELNTLRKERTVNRQSIQAVEEAKIKQREAEAARAHLEERMMALSKKKKKNALNCF